MKRIVLTDEGKRAQEVMRQLEQQTKLTTERFVRLGYTLSKRRVNYCAVCDTTFIDDTDEYLCIHCRSAT